MFTLAFNKYLPISRDVGNNANYGKEKFGSATQNWMNFQQTVKPDDTFQTTTANSFKEFNNRSEPFALKNNALTKNEQALAEYRAKWTSGNHNFKRTYLGAGDFKKCNQD